VSSVPPYQPWDGYEDIDDEDTLIRRLEWKIDESRDRYDRAYAQAVCAAVANHEQLKQQRSDDRYRQRLHQRASDLYDEVGGWQRS
jgi:hypothetical protein